jgi:methylphosphotriester-DNA--protein-cysteine methyltransferase
MNAELNSLIDAVEQDLAEDLDVAEFVARIGTTEYHVRRMFSSLAGMPLSEYVRRRRMTVAAASVIAGGPLLDVAVRFGYGSTEDGISSVSNWRVVPGCPQASGTGSRGLYAECALAIVISTTWRRRIWAATDSQPGIEGQSR